jgi:hypothetical protein
MAFAANPPRRTERRTHLNVDTAIVERALLARARSLAESVLQEPEQESPDDVQAMAGGVQQAVRSLIAQELAALAEELHWR